MYIGKNAPGSHKEDLEREQQEVIRGEHLSDFIFKIHETNLPSYSNAMLAVAFLWLNLLIDLLKSMMPPKITVKS